MVYIGPCCQDELEQQETCTVADRRARIGHDFAILELRYD